MANSFVAVADDPSALWYNPAAITELENTQILLGSTMILPAIKHEYTGGSDEIPKVLHVPPHFYITRKINEKISAGFGLTAPFGLQTNWDLNSRASNVATLSDLKVLNYNLNLAYKLTEKLSVAAGVNYVYLDAELDKYLSSLSFEQKLKGDGTAWGYNVAAFYKLDDKWNFGASFRSPIKIDIEDGTIILPPGTTYNDANTSIKLPDMLQFGAAYKMNEKWLLSLTFDYTDWTTYRSIIIKYNNDTQTSIDTKNWKSVWAYRLGTQYKYSDSIKLLAGISYDKNPVREKYFETRMPDSDRIGLSLGVNYTKDNFVLDVSYAAILFDERKIDDSTKDIVNNIDTQTLNGTYKSTAHIPAISFGYKF